MDIFIFQHPKDHCESMQMLKIRSKNQGFDQVNFKSTHKNGLKMEINKKNWENHNDKCLKMWFQKLGNL